MSRRRNKQPNTQIVDIPTRTLCKALNRAKRYHRYIQKLKARIDALEAKLEQKSDVIERLVFGDPVTRVR